MKHPGSKSVGWALVQAARLHRGRMGEKLASMGLFAGQEQVVQALAAQGQMTMGELAAVLRVRPPTASKTVSRLAALGLVERRTEAGDARVVRVRLTETGRERSQAITAIWDEVEDELLGGFDGKDRKRLRKYLRKAARNLADLTGSDARGLDVGDEDGEPEGEEPESGGAPPAEAPLAEAPPGETQSAGTQSRDALPAGT